jgi:hypothetical protein
MRYQSVEVFPTTILKVDVENAITAEDREMMVRSVDQLYDRGDWDKDPLKPQYQTHPILFSDQAPPIWHKLRQTFIDACYLYLKAVEDVHQFQANINILQVRAWCYKSDRETKQQRNNPMHTHRPSYLSGVYYLKLPNDSEDTVGTEFGDIKGITLGASRDVIVTNDLNCWSIFPGGMPHRAVQIDSDLPRYVIAADAFVGLK